ncbi:MAG: 2-amino-4-hydroxy-6-hydroxymethyldihydropteridine diphosphokinase [Cyanobacteria bacterium J06632_19]
MLLYDDLILHTPTLQIPHPEMTQRGFVLVPSSEIIPHCVEPIRRKRLKNYLTM